MCVVCRYYVFTLSQHSVSSFTFEIFFLRIRFALNTIVKNLFISLHEDPKTHCSVVAYNQRLGPICSLNNKIVLRVDILIVTFLRKESIDSIVGLFVEESAHRLVSNWSPGHNWDTARSLSGFSLNAGPEILPLSSRIPMGWVVDKKNTANASKTDDCLRQRRNYHSPIIYINVRSGDDGVNAIMSFDCVARSEDRWRYPAPTPTFVSSSVASQKLPWDKRKTQRQTEPKRSGISLLQDSPWIMYCRKLFRCRVLS